MLKRIRKYISEFFYEYIPKRGDAPDIVVDKRLLKDAENKEKSSFPKVKNPPLP